jgi:hypothetical protein
MYVEATRRIQVHVWYMLQQHPELDVITVGDQVYQIASHLQAA